VDSVTPGSGAYPGKRLKIIFPSVNRRVRLTVTTDDGITGQAGPVQIYAPPPITIEQEGTSFRAVLSSRPRDLQGWSYILETSIDLQTWTPASAASTTVTANPDGTSDRISVLLPAGPGKQFIRLKAATP
ncbi:MAG TPA: hypothetical protein VHM91_25945, partial [Verrucomicrobiales bacterium]|nr:hypothetical protein [Verrucomicrobiales bacterium]